MGRVVISVLILATSAVPAFAAAAIQVPEPATMTLFGVGACGAYLVKRFTNRK